MKHSAKLVSLLTAGTLLGCAQPWGPAVATGQAAADAGSRAPLQASVQPLQSASGAVSTTEGLFILGRAAQAAGQSTQAEERFAQVLALQPQHLGALNAVAVIYAQTQRAEQAVELFQRALALDPQAAHVHNNLGYALMLAGRLAESQAELERARELSPSNWQTGQNLELLAQTRERVAAGPQLVEVGRNVYELRDRPGLAQPVLQAQAQLPNRVQAPAQAGSVTLPLQSAARPDLQGVRVEVSNGVGIRHLARRTAERLAPTGVVTARLTNQQPYRQARTEIQFGKGQQMAAQALSASFPVPVKTIGSNSLLKGIQLRLVLGHDPTGKAVLAWLESAGEIRIALSLEDGWRWS